MEPFEAVALKYSKDDGLQVLDQRKLPHAEEWACAKTPDDMVQLIKQLSVRGAPLIGVAASASLGLYASEGTHSKEEILDAAKRLRDARPTAVNLMWAMDRMTAALEKDAKADLAALAKTIREEDQAMCERMAKHGAALVKKGESILTHCNTGALATGGIGTALGVIEIAHREGKNIHVYVDETRPLLQGGRLTTWELQRLGVPYTLITDNMAASLMRSGKIDRVFVGADRIATNGDFANKIGTYSVAVLAKYHNVPFHPVAPVSTVDFECATGDDIPVEHRKPAEVQGVAGFFGTVQWAPDCKVYNPAFDVTPVDLVASLILDSGVYSQKDLNAGALKNMAR